MSDLDALLATAAGRERVNAAVAKALDWCYLGPVHTPEAGENRGWRHPRWAGPYMTLPDYLSDEPVLNREMEVALTDDGKRGVGVQYHPRRPECDPVFTWEVWTIPHIMPGNAFGATKAIALVRALFGAGVATLDEEDHDGQG